MQRDLAPITLLTASITKYLADIERDIQRDNQRENAAARARIRKNALLLAKAAKALKLAYKEDGDK